MQTGCRARHLAHRPAHPTEHREYCCQPVRLRSPEALHRCATGQNASNATINRELSVIRRGFSLAYGSDPPLVARVPYIEKLEEQNVREGFVEPDQYLKLREALPKRLQCLLVVGYHVGCRKGELLKVCRDQIDLRHGEIRLTEGQTKGKKARTLPIYGEMRPWLEMQLAELEHWWPSCRWVFHHNGRRLDPHLSGWRECCKKVGLPALMFHDLRRSAVKHGAGWHSSKGRDADQRPQDRSRLPTLRYRDASGSAARRSEDGAILGSAEIGHRIGHTSRGATGSYLGSC